MEVDDRGEGSSERTLAGSNNNTAQQSPCASNANTTSGSSKMSLPDGFWEDMKRIVCDDMQRFVDESKS